MTRGTPEWVVRSVRDWALAVGHGMALVTYRWAGARDFVLVQLAEEFARQGLRVATLRCANLPLAQFGEELQASDADVVFVLDIDTYLNQNSGWLNFQRERLVAHPSAQVWWMLPEGALRLGRELPDLNRFFLFREELTTDPPALESLQLAVEHPTGDRSQAEFYLQRAQRAIDGRGEPARIWLELGIPAIQELLAANAVDEAERAFLRLEDQLGPLDEHLLKAEASHSVAQAYAAEGELFRRAKILMNPERALASYQTASRAYAALGEIWSRRVSQGKIADILITLGRLDEAMALHQQEEAICRELGDRAGLQASLGNQALILKDRGQLDEAMALLKQQEAICRDLGDRAGLSSSLANQALILHQQGARDEGHRRMREAYQGFRDLGMPVERDQAAGLLRDLFADEV